MRAIVEAASLGGISRTDGRCRLAELPGWRRDAGGHVVFHRERYMRRRRRAKGDRFLECRDLPERHVDAGRGASSATATATAGRLTV